MVTRTFFAAVILLFAACARESSTAHDPTADRAAVAATMDRYVVAIRNNDYAAVAGFWTDDAVYIAPGAATIRGRAAIDSLVRSNFAAMPVTEITAQADETVVDQDFAFQTGTFSETVQPAQGSAQAISGRFLFVWKRQPDGTWKVARGIATDLPGS